MLKSYMFKNKIVDSYAMKIVLFEEILKYTLQQKVLKYEPNITRKSILFFSVAIS